MNGEHAETKYSHLTDRLDALLNKAGNKSFKSLLRLGGLKHESENT